MKEMHTTGRPGSIRKVFTNRYSKISMGVLVKFDERDLIDGKYIIPSTVRKIGTRAFRGCKNLKEIEIPSTVKEIGDEAFLRCNGITNIVFNEGLEVIGERAFAESTNSEANVEDVENVDPNVWVHINLPNSIKTIGEGAFSDFISLKSVSLPSGIKILESGLFSYSSNLQNVVIPASVQEIKDYCFADCVSLKEVIVPEAVERLDGTALTGCRGLKKIDILNESIDIDGRFQIGAAQSLENVNLPKSLIHKLPLSIFASGNLIINGTKYEQGKNLRRVSSRVLESLGKQHSKEEVFNMNFKWLRNVCKYVFGENYSINSEEVSNLQSMCYHLGVMSQETQLAQTMGEFIKVLHDKGLLREEIIKAFSAMSDLGVNKGFSTFFKDNYNAIIQKLEDSNEEQLIGLLVEIHDRFDELVKSFVSDNAAARQKKPTLEFFENTLSKDRFGVYDEKYDEIAKEMLKFVMYTKEDFEKACKVYEQYLEATQTKKVKVSKGVIKKCIEKAFTKMDELENGITNDLNEATANLGQAISQEETWEWLEKNDPLNFTLGLYCNCCARIGGAGEGIAIGSILDPNVRNLIVRDSKNRPIAKATLYINAEKGYALFNNFEVANAVKEEKKSKVYMLLKDATNNFVRNYNKEALVNGVNPIKKVNVGMSLNDLERFIRENDMQSSTILEGLDFSKFSKGTYAGDWRSEQYTFLSIVKGGTREAGDGGKTVK